MSGPVELLPTDGFAWSGRTAGFIAKTIFYDEPTANRDVKIPTAFFQDFGIPYPSMFFQSIDEHYLGEATLFDVRKFGEDGLLAAGLALPVEQHRQVKTAWVPLWPPMLRLVEIEPEWRSVDFTEDIERRKVIADRDEMERKIASTCFRCAELQPCLAVKSVLDVERYVHGTHYDRTSMCLANKLHQERDTAAIELVDKKEEVA